MERLKQCREPIIHWKPPDSRPRARGVRYQVCVDRRAIRKRAGRARLPVLELVSQISTVRQNGSQRGNTEPRHVSKRTGHASRISVFGASHGRCGLRDESGARLGLAPRYRSGLQRQRPGRGDACLRWLLVLARSGRADRTCEIRGAGNHRRKQNRRWAAHESTSANGAVTAFPTLAGLAAASFPASWRVRPRTLPE